MSRDLTEIARAYDAIHGRRADAPVADDPWHLWVQGALDRARDLDGKRVLEAGCGRGALTHWLSSQAAKATVVGTDVSTAALRRAAVVPHEGTATPVGWPASDVAQLPFADGAFDTVICCETIEHVLDPAAAVRELARVVAPGGRLWITAPSYLNPTGLYRGYLRLRGRRYDEGGQPVANFTMLPQTIGWVRASGLTVERVDGVGHYLPFPGRAPVRFAALDARVLRPLCKWTALHCAIIAHKAPREPSA